MCRFLYQSTQNFMLISKMYNFICLFWVVHELFAKKLSFFARFWDRAQKWQFFANNSWNIQNKHIKLYIFEISMKFRVDWHMSWHILRNFKIFHFSRWSISRSRVWEPKIPQEIRNIVIFWSGMTHYNFLDPSSKNFDICRVLI